MFQNNSLTKAVRLAIVYSAAATAAMTSTSAVSAEDEEVERIEVTGSAIKRTDMEGALPVQVLSQEDIARTGVTNVADLMQQLPAMQGFTTAGESVGGGGGGVQTASIHDIGEQYTLVLLNGRRIAPATSGSTVNLNGIPLNAIERVEILTDGASALYGSDAIAGVVNFILKKNVQQTTVSVRADRPQEDGGESYSASIVSGFGDLDSDGFNITFSYVHEEQDQLASKDRDFADSGIIPFKHNGRDLYFFNGSGNAIPGNARVNYNNAAGENVRSAAFNPYSLANNGCAENTSAIAGECWFDYTSTIEILPENDRDSLFIQADFEINDDLRAFSTAVWSKFSMTSRIAPYPTGWFNIPVDSPLVTNEIIPNLTDEQAAGLTGVQGRWRALPAGNRTTEYETETRHIVLGIEGVAGDIDYGAGFTYSQSTLDQDRPEGWLLEEPFYELMESGAVNIFAHPSEITDAEQALLSDTVYSGDWNETKVTMLAFDAKASAPVFELPGGDAYFAAGFDYRSYKYENTLSQANEDEVLLFASSGTPYELERDSYGLFAELAMPVLDNLDITGSLRYDSIGGVDDKLLGSEVSDDESDVTYKLSANYQATDDLLLRASYGTGFKAPSMLQIARPRVPFGVTGGNFECPFTGDDPLAQYCLTGRSQYGVYLQGYPDLKPETSEQYTLGFVYAPSQEFSFGADYWSVELEDLVTSLTEQQIFDNADLYRDLFITRTNNGTGEEELAILQTSVNVGQSSNKGIDWHMDITNELSFGELHTSLSGTYMIESEYTRPGTDDVWVTSMGQFGENDAVTFRNIIKVTSTLTHGDFAHTASLSYRSGYRDQYHTAESFAVTEVDAFGDGVDIQLNIPSYTTIDYQTKYFFQDTLSVTFGINNLFDREPPFSLQTSGGGHQVGYDPRYSDAYGRTFFLGVDYTF